MLRALVLTWCQPKAGCGSIEEGLLVVVASNEESGTKV
jgi:hypothetical protein